VIFQVVIGQEEIKIFSVPPTKDNKKVKKAYKIKLGQQILPLKIRKLKIINLGLINFINNL